MRIVGHRIVLLSSPTGWAGAIGLIALVVAGVLGVTLLLPAIEEGEDLQSEVGRLQTRIASSGTAARPVNDMHLQMDEFLSSLPREDQINAQLTLLNELAALNQVALKNGVYRTTSGKGAHVGELQISMKTDASYMDLRHFLQTIPEVLPALSVGRVSLIRQKRSDSAIESNLEFVLFFLRSGT